MGKNAYNKCIELMKEIKQTEAEQIPIQALRLHIAKKIGGDQRTISTYFNLLKQYGFIENQQNGIFKINQIEIKQKLY